MGKNASEIKNDLIAQIDAASAADALQRIESSFKKAVKELFSEMKSLPPEEKKDAGQAVNDMKKDVESRLQAAREKLLSAGRANVRMDLSVKSLDYVRGKVHPLIRVGKMMEDVYRDMGFSIAYGPEIENDAHNYEMLNMPYYHPARDMQDTFYLNYPKVLLRSHTSCVQIRHMLAHKPPIMIISPGVVYRTDEIDPQHTPCFYQVEGLVVGEGINLANLKWALTESVQRVFGQAYKVKFSPSYYPYTEPSAAVDMSCIICGGAGCRTCKGTGWLRIAGSGMVHPNVFEAVGYPRDTAGFAFGWGLNKFPMLYYKIAEMRKLFENEIKLWEQL
ncbi:MAG: phenylalanine--tRNA ligase subunit alpha [Clostridiales Family XIII bacterium]|nr:phenylalanine--tRNA ligase subunit alpha [Clostridiales Family XIII bacterium]